MDCNITKIMDDLHETADQAEVEIVRVAAGNLTPLRHLQKALGAEKALCDDDGIVYILYHDTDLHAGRSQWPWRIKRHRGCHLPHVKKIQDALVEEILSIRPQRMSPEGVLIITDLMKAWTKETSHSDVAKHIDTGMNNCRMEMIVYAFMKECLG